VEVTPHGLNPLAGGRIVLGLPLRNDVVAGPDLQQLPENQGPALRGGLFEGEGFHVAVVDQEMSRITLKRRISQEEIHIRVIFQPRMCNLRRGKVQEPFQNLKASCFPHISIATKSLS
jgi:hypothetical protein